VVLRNILVWTCVIEQEAHADEQVLSFRATCSTFKWQRLAQMSSEVLQVTQGSLCPALQRMKRKGWIRSEWRSTDNNRRARYYILTTRGKKQLALERAEFERSAGAVFQVLAWSGGVA
jgi:DNA-binding transcriptional regulator PaaX